MSSEALLSNIVPNLYSQGSGGSFCPEEQFLDVSEKVLSKTSPSISRYIAANVWKSQGDIRDVISIGKLVRKSDGPLEIEQYDGKLTKASL